MESIWVVIFGLGHLLLICCFTKMGTLGFTNVMECDYCEVVSDFVFIVQDMA